MKMDAITLLKADHEKVNSLFKKAENAEGSELMELFGKIEEELQIHTHIEETILYPRLKQIEELKDLTLEAVEEHHQAKVLLREISALSDGSEKIEPKIKVLQEDIEHHVEEEESEMFPQMQQFLTAEDLETLGAELEAEKSNYKKSKSAAR
jgi:iron-sulfur cluster repair protein YtfE (RIC family)